MSSTGIRPKSLRVKTRLKPRVHLLGASTRKSKPGFKFAEKSITEFLSEHPLSEFLEVNDIPQCVKLLSELMFVVKSSKANELHDDNNFKEIFMRISSHRFNDDYRIRTLTIRIVRLLTLTNDRVILLLQQNFWITLLRGLDLIELVEDERMECLKLVSKLLSHYYSANSSFKRLISSDERFRLFLRYSLKCLVSIALTQYNAPKEALSDGNFRREEPAHCSQRLSVTALGILLEAAVYELFLVVEFIGTDWLVQCFEMFYTVNVRISSFAHQIFAKWLDSPHLREFAELHLVLQKVSAPFIDLGFFQHPPKDSNSAGFFKMSEGLEACVQALSDIMHTWSGLFACIATEKSDEFVTRLHVSSPLRIIPYLGLSTLTSNGLKMRNVIVDACCEFIGASYASKTFSNWQEAVLFYSQMHLPDGYKHSLRDDFVVGEMSTLMRSRQLYPNETDLLLCFRSVVAFALIQAGIIQALCRLVIMHPDDSMSIKATLLLSDFLNLTSTYLPREWRLKTMAIPELIRSVAENFSQHSNPIFTQNANEIPLFSPRTLADGMERRQNSTVNSGNIFGNVPSINSQRHPFSYNNSDSVAASTNVENSFSLFNRLDKLTEISLLRNSPPLLDQLQDVNIFLLNGTCANGTNDRRSVGSPSSPLDMPTLSALDLDLSALEQSLLDVSSKLYLGTSNNNSSSTSPSANSSGDGFVLGVVDPIKKESIETENLQAINWRFVDQLLQILESTRSSAIAETLQKFSKLTERCHLFFSAVCNQFLPSNHLLVRNYANSATNFDVLHAINCGRRAFNFAAQQIGTPSNASNTFTNFYGRTDEEIITNSTYSSAASSSEQAFHFDLIQTFAADFRAELSGINTYTGTFTPKNLLNTNALYYFAIIRIISQYDSGFKILEKSGLFQIFFDLILNNSESIEYTKLIVTSLNYFRPGISRVILQTAISSNDKKVRKWTTRFLNILIGLSDDDCRDNSRPLLSIPSRTTSLSIPSRTTSSVGSATNDGFSPVGVVEFALRLAIRQLSDESAKIVLHALQILIDWLPLKPKYIGLLELVNMKMYGNAGRILEAIYYRVEENLYAHSMQQKIKNDVTDALEYWMKEFNEKYVEILEEEMRRLGLNVKRSMRGRFGRSSHAKENNCSLSAPPHLLGSLANHKSGRKLLIRQKIVQRLLAELRAFLEWQSKRTFQQNCFGFFERLGINGDDFADDNQYDELRCRRVKAALLAMSQIVRGYDICDDSKISSLLADGLAMIVEFASRCEWLTVRGCAFWALNIAGCSKFGVRILSEYGWECASSTDLSHILSSATKTASTEPNGNDLTHSQSPSNFSIGKFYSFEVGSEFQRNVRNDNSLRQRSRSACKLFTCAKNLRSGSHFLRRSASNSELFSGCELGISNKVTPQNTPRELTTRLRENEITSNYLFLSENEQTRLISYRNLLAEIENSESNTAEEDFVRPRMTVFKEQKRVRVPFPIIYLPAQITSICMNVFSTIGVPYKSSNGSKIYSHSKLRCLHCSGKGHEIDRKIPQSVCDAYKRRGAEILRLVDRLQVRMANAGSDKNDRKDGKNNKKADGSASEKREDLDKTNSVATTQTRLLRIFSEFPGAFMHPCLYSNVVTIIADSKLNSAHRRFIHQLFWKSHV